jgi:hypothetical protein
VVSLVFEARDRPSPVSRVTLGAGYSTD